MSRPKRGNAKRSNGVVCRIVEVKKWDGAPWAPRVYRFSCDVVWVNAGGLTKTREQVTCMGCISAG